MGIAMKICTNCGLSQDATPGTGEFYSNKRNSDGLGPWCKSCIKAYQAARYAAHPELAKARSAAWIAANPELAKARSAAWIAANPEYITANGHYRFAHKPLYKKYSIYKNMAFCLEWDTAKGMPKAAATFARNAAQWMKQHLPKPGPGYELHVLKTKKHPYGYFGPGGIVWRHKADRHDQAALDVVCEWGIKKFKNFVRQELKRRCSTM